MDRVRVEARSRTETGKSVARKLRAQGQVPGVVYGLHREAQALTVGEDVVHRLRRLGHALVDLTIDGRPGDEGVAAIVKSIEHHPVTWNPRSIDFQWVSLTENVEVPVPLVLTGEAPGAEIDGGVVDQLLYEVTVRCLPTAIPSNLHMDISNLHLGETLHVRDLVLPEGIEVVTDTDEVVVSCLTPRIEVETEAEAGEEVAHELAEGEEPDEGEADERA
ncbi:MAG: 50S ribosomal protein L25 [Armatimonadota bacterium]